MSEKIIVRGSFTHASTKEREEMRDVPLWFIDSDVPGFKGYRFGYKELRATVSAARDRGIEVVDHRTRTLTEWVMLKRSGGHKIGYEWMLEHGMTSWSARYDDTIYELALLDNGLFGYECVDDIGGTTIRNNMTLSEAMAILEEIEMTPEECVL